MFAAGGPVGGAFGLTVCGDWFRLGGVRASVLKADFLSA